MDGSKLILFFVSSVIQKLVSTVKSMKGLRETLTLPWTRRIEISYFFNELARGFARSFMVHSLAWRLPILFMARGVQSHSFVTRMSKVSTNCETGYLNTRPLDRIRSSRSTRWDDRSIQPGIQRI